MTRLMLTIFVAFALALPIAGCGKKGPPKLPEGQSDEYPRSYPAGS